MPWSGSGVFTRLYSWVADAAAGIDISSTRTDADTNDITANGFGNCLTRDGQGSASANLPMNGFRFTNVGNGQNAQDLVTLAQITPPGITLPAIISPALLGDMKLSALPEALFGALAPGWHVCAGQTRPRTDPLWVATGGTYPGSWAFGNGDGSTTYTLPDFRGRVPVGKDNMGGAAASRVTAGVSGIDGLTLGAVGGNQNAQTDSITVNVSGSIGALSSGASTAVSTVTDPGHLHNISIKSAAGGSGNVTGTASTSVVAAQASDTAVTGITVGTSVTTNVTTNVYDARTWSATSGLTGSSQNMPPATVSNYIIFTGA